MRTAKYTGAGRSELSEIDYSAPVLRRYSDAAAIRNATQTETKESREAAKHDGGSGVIEVGGVSCYVEE